MLSRVLTDEPDSSFCGVKKYSRSRATASYFCALQKKNQTHPPFIEVFIC